MSFDLNDAEQMKRVLIDPIVDSIRAEIKPLSDRLTAVEGVQSNLGNRVQKLEGVASKVLTVYSGLIAVGTYFAHYLWAKIQKII